MAKFNKNIYGFMNYEQQRKEITNIIPMIQEMLSKEDYEQMRKDYHEMCYDELPFWKYVFENIEVKYKGGR